MSEVIITPFGLPWQRTADFQRQTCLELAKKHTVVVYLRDEAVSIFKKAATASYPEIKNVIFYTPRYIIPGRRWSSIEKLNQLLCVWWVAHKYSPNRKPILWIFDPWFHFFTHLNFMVTSLYDCVDYHDTHQPNIAREIRRNELNLLLKAEFVFVNSTILQKLHSQIRADLKLVPQGFDLDSFIRSPLPPPINVSNWKQPVIGFVGAINERLNYQLLLKVITARPQWTFVFWGPVSIQGGKANQLWTKVRKKSNVVWGESDNRREVAGIIKQFKVAIIPYNLTLKLNLYSYPMKLFEYYFMGKPVVATPILELQRYDKFAILASTATDWLSELDKLVEKSWPRNFQQRQRELAYQNTWAKKIQSIFKTLDKSKS